MDALLTYRGKRVSQQDVVYIRTLIKDNPRDSRWTLSRKLCLAWNWRQPNGALRDMLCRGLMLELHRAGHIQLPPKKQNPANPLAHRNKPAKITIDQDPLQGPLSLVVPLQIRQVRRTTSEKLFNSLIEHYHYLGYCQPVGEHLKYVVFAEQRPVACVAFCSAPRHIGCRDRFIGWPARVRRQNLHLIAYQSRFLILPWVQVPHLASHLLGRMARVLPKDWQRVYHHPVYFLETFVDLERFKGTCYRAANWIYLGKTTGRGKDDQTHKANRSIKAVWGYPLTKDFREHLCK
ncbi:MAG: DUF4338 domain-containing protein [candidate division Zixibacteria bacterium]|nr:DUF4338 domain-containing protein [candidate division Zixibacteria bacterium]